MMFRLRPFSLYRIYATGSDSPLAAVYSLSSRPPCIFDFFFICQSHYFNRAQSPLSFRARLQRLEKSENIIIWKVRDKLREVKQ